MSQVYPIPLKCQECNGAKFVNKVLPTECMICNKDRMFLNVQPNCKCKGNQVVYTTMNLKCRSCNGTGKMLITINKHKIKSKL